MLRHAKGLWLVLFAMGMACSDEAASTREEPAPPSPIDVEPAARYYRSFDPLTLTGIQELDRDSIDRPFVAITWSADGDHVRVEGEMKDPAIDSNCRFSVAYELRADAFVRRQFYGPAEKGYDYTEETCHVHANEEFCYFYLRKHHATPPVGPRNALFAYTRENRQERVEFYFPVWGPLDQRTIDTIPFTSDNPLPQKVRQKAFLMSTIRYSRNEAGEIQTTIETRQWFDDGVPYDLDTDEPKVHERSDSIPQFYLRLDELTGC